MSEIRNEIIGGKQSDDGLSNNVDTYLNFTALQTALPTPTVGMLAFVQNTASTYVCYTAGIWTEQGGGSSALVEHTYSFANQTNFIITHNLGRIPSIVRVLDLDYIDITAFILIDHIGINSFEVSSGEIISGVIKYY